MSNYNYHDDRSRIGSRRDYNYDGRSRIGSRRDYNHYYRSRIGSRPDYNHYDRSLIGSRRDRSRERRESPNIPVYNPHYWLETKKREKKFEDMINIMMKAPYNATSIVNRISSTGAWLSFEKGKTKLKNINLRKTIDFTILDDMIEFPLNEHIKAWKEYLFYVNQKLLEKRNHIINKVNVSMSEYDILKQMITELNEIALFGPNITNENIEFANCGVLIRKDSGKTESACNKYYKQKLPENSQVEIDALNGVHYHIFNKQKDLDGDPIYEMQLTLRSKLDINPRGRGKRKRKKTRRKRKKTGVKRKKTGGKRKGNRVKTRRKWRVRKKKTRKGRRKRTRKKV